MAYTVKLWATPLCHDSRDKKTLKLSSDGFAGLNSQAVTLTKELIAPSVEGSRKVEICNG